MECLGIAASVIAVVELSAKVTALCLQYSTAVAHARDDIARLCSGVKSLGTTLQHAKRLLEEPNNRPLSTSRKLIDQLSECQVELEKLWTKLELGTTRKAMRRFGLRALKWPFSSEENESLITRLERYQNIIVCGLQIDQTVLLLGISKRVENLSLRTIENVSTTRKPHFLVPFPRDPDFVDRPTILTWMTENYAGSAGRIALVGLGGFGKSQIAIEFAHRLHATSPDISVFWVHGSTMLRFEESYRSIADALALPHRHDPRANILALVRDWLERQQVSPWLLILDNADALDTFFAKNEGTDREHQPLASYLPKAGNGKILITSRNLNAAEKLTGSHRAILRISTMEGCARG